MGTKSSRDERNEKKKKKMPQLEPNYFINSVSWGLLMIGVLYIIMSRYILPISVRSELIRLTLLKGVKKDK